MALACMRERNTVDAKKSYSITCLKIGLKFSGLFSIIYHVIELCNLTKKLLQSCMYFFALFQLSR